MTQDLIEIRELIAKKWQELKDGWRDLGDRLELEKNKGKDIALEDLQAILAVRYPEVFGKRKTETRSKR